MLEMLSKRYCSLTIITILIVSLNIGCSIKKGEVKLTPPVYNKTNIQLDKELIKRINEYWHYRKANEPEKSFQFEYRKYMGKKLDKIYKNYVKFTSKAKIKKIEITNVYNEGNNKICVDLKFYYFKPNMLGQKYFFQKDCWKKVKGAWLHIMGFKILFKY